MSEFTAKVEMEGDFVSITYYCDGEPYHWHYIRKDVYLKILEKE